MLLGNVTFGGVKCVISSKRRAAIVFHPQSSDELAPFHKQVAERAFLVEPIVLQPDSEGHYISVMTQVEQDLSPILFLLECGPQLV